jgi:hypothetical protein
MGRHRSSAGSAAQSFSRSWENECNRDVTFYDFNVWSEGKRIEKLRYMHRNPVKRGLVNEAEQSSGGGVEQLSGLLVWADRKSPD